MQPKISMHTSPLRMVLLLAPLMLSLLGCSNELKTVPVEGKITYAGGDWPKTARVTFACEEVAPGFDMHPADATLKPDGSFRVDLVPGKYVLNLECWDVEPSMENPAAAKSFLPDSHRSGMQSGFRVDVKPDAKIVKFEGNVPKPE
jgi:hypothetical protein